VRLAPTIKRWARRVGLEIGRYDSTHSPHARRRRLMRDAGVDVVFDIGANAGYYATDLRAAGYMGRIVSLEPLSGAFAELERLAAGDPRWDVLMVAAGEAEATAEINVTANSWSSSLLPFNADYATTAPGLDVVGVERVRVVPLDAIAAEHAAAGAPAMVKLDVQGLELGVLRGAHTTLERAVLVEAELSLAELYRGQPLYREVIDHLDATGFDLVGLDPHYTDPRTGYLLQMDGLFARRPGG
jgi:FkbM family methyltransferase